MRAPLAARNIAVQLSRNGKFKMRQRLKYRGKHVSVSRHALQTSFGQDPFQSRIACNTIFAILTSMPHFIEVAGVFSPDSSEILPETPQCLRKRVCRRGGSSLKFGFPAYAAMTASAARSIFGRILHSNLFPFQPLVRRCGKFLHKFYHNSNSAAHNAAE